MAIFTFLTAHFNSIETQSKEKVMFTYLCNAENAFTLEKLESLNPEETFHEAELEYEEVCLVLETVDEDMSKLASVFELTAAMGKCTRPEAEFAIKAINIPANDLCLELSIESIFTEVEGAYEVSMEAIASSWKDIYNFIASALKALFRAFKKLIDHFLSTTGRMQQTTRALMDQIKKETMTNPKIVTKTIPFPRACRYIVSGLEGTRTGVIKDLPKVEAYIDELIAYLDPSEVREKIKNYLNSIILNADREENVLIKGAYHTRKSLIASTAAYLGIRIPSGDINASSEPGAGFAVFNLVADDFAFKAPVIKLEYFADKDIKEYEGKPCNKDQAMRHLKLVDNAAYAILKLRADYDVKSDFKSLAKDASKALKTRRDAGLTITNADSALFKSSVSYARLSNNILKLKSEALFNAVLGLFTYVLTSRKQWEVKIN